VLTVGIATPMIAKRLEVAFKTTTRLVKIDPLLLFAQVKTGRSGISLTATSGRSPSKKLVFPTTGPKVGRRRT
jgi:hypothetical protein